MERERKEIDLQMHGGGSSIGAMRTGGRSFGFGEVKTCWYFVDGCCGIILCVALSLDVLMRRSTKE